MNYDEQLEAMAGYAEKIAVSQQGSGEWLNARIGHCTASRFKDVLDFTKSGKEGAKRAAYRMELLIERLTGSAREHFMTDAMQWGSDQEPMARMAYESATGALVEPVGFIRHPAIKLCGGSPDGLIDDDGGVEFKCPTTPTHINVLLNGECEHLPQIQGLMWITGRQWWDYVSYDPRLPLGLRLHVQRIARDDEYIAKLSAAVIQLLQEVDEMQRALLAIALSSAPHGSTGISAAAPSQEGVGQGAYASADDPNWRTGDVPPLEP